MFTHGTCAYRLHCCLSCPCNAFHEWKFQHKQCNIHWPGGPFGLRNIQLKSSVFVYFVCEMSKCASNSQPDIQPVGETDRQSDAACEKNLYINIFRIQRMSAERTPWVIVMVMPNSTRSDVMPPECIECSQDGEVWSNANICSFVGFKFEYCCRVLIASLCPSRNSFLSFLHDNNF